MSTARSPLPSGLAAPSNARPLPHFTAPPSLRPSRAPLPPAASPPSPPTRSLRQDSLRIRGGANDEGTAADGRDARLEAVLENRRLQGVAVAAAARPPREAQPAHGQGGGVGGRRHDAHGQAWHDEGDDNEEREVLRSTVPNRNGSSSDDDVALNPGKVDLSRMTSTRRYMAELDEDDEPLPGEGDRSTWHSGGWESEARDSIASLEPLQRVGHGGARGRSRLGPPRDSALTMGSVDTDPFSYSVRRASRFSPSSRVLTLASSRSTPLFPRHATRPTSRMPCLPPSLTRLSTCRRRPSHTPAPSTRRCPSCG